MNPEVLPEALGGFGELNFAFSKSPAAPHVSILPLGTSSHWQIFVQLSHLKSQTCRDHRFFE